MSAGWLCWEPDRLFWRSETKDTIAELEASIPFERVREIGFTAGETWQLVIPSGDGYRFFIGPNGPNWTVLQVVMPNGELDQARPLLQPHAGVVALVEWERNHLTVGTLGDGWRGRSLPLGARWAGVDTDGLWWAVGSKPSSRIPTADREVALWRDEGSDSWREEYVRLTSWWRAVQIIRKGGFEELQAINAAGEPLIVASQCAWFLDDPSWFLFVRRNDGRFYGQRLARRRLASLNRDSAGSPLARTMDGECWDWTGTEWRPRGYADELYDVLDPLFEDRPVIHLSVGAELIRGVARSSGEPESDPVAIQRANGRWSIVDLDLPTEARVQAAWNAPDHSVDT